MADRLTPQQRRKNMQHVRNKDSRIEIILRRALWAEGVRYRKNTNRVFGHPDIAMIGLKIAVFCDSEFWHGYDWENRKNDIKSNREFWIPKIERNIQRDIEVTEHLEKEGWIVLRFFGKEIINDTDNCIKTILNAINSRRKG